MVTRHLRISSVHHPKCAHCAMIYSSVSSGRKILPYSLSRSYSLLHSVVYLGLLTSAPPCSLKRNFSLWGPTQKIFAARPDYRESFSSNLESQRGRNEEQIFMTKVWMSLKEARFWNGSSIFNENTAPSQILSWGRWCYTAMCVEGRVLRLS